MADLKTLTSKRGLVRTKITKLSNITIANYSIWNAIEKSAKLNKAEELHDEVAKLDEEILALAIAEGETVDQLEDRSSADETYTDLLYSIRSMLNTQNSQTTTVQTNMPASSKNGSALKLPPVELPKFGNGKEENLGKFLNILDSILSKYSYLSEHQKFLLLQGQLSGPPRILVDTLDFDLHTYTEAKKALKDAFDSSEKSKENLIDTLASLKLGNNEEPYKYIGQVRTLISGIKSLNITTDDFMRHFVWQGLNPAFQNHIIAITNKTSPTFQEISDNLFDAADRYNKTLSVTKPVAARTRADSSYNKSNDAVAMATNVQRKPQWCNLCRHDKKPSEHNISRCPVYETGKAKCDKLRQLKHCLKCAFSNHDTSKCQFNFKNKCRTCNGDHFTFLCWKTNRNDRINANEIAVDLIHEDDASVNNCIATYNAEVTNKQILPTFTAQIKVNNDTCVPFRIFKDGGATSSFVSKDVAEFHNFTVVK